MLYREPKLLKGAFYRAHIKQTSTVSVLYREPKLLKDVQRASRGRRGLVSVLYREPKLLKAIERTKLIRAFDGFSALP